MTQFQLDTSGVVTITLKPGYAFSCLAFDDLSPFVQGYIEAALKGLSLAPVALPKGGYGWDITDLNQAEWWCDEIPADAPAFRAVAFSDLAPETLARIVADCDAWRVEYSESCKVDPPASVNMGRCFWGLRQSNKATGFPPLTVQLGDDGNVRFQ